MKNAYEVASPHSCWIKTWPEFACFPERDVYPLEDDRSRDNLPAVVFFPGVRGRFGEVIFRAVVYVCNSRRSGCDCGRVFVLVCGTFICS